MREAGTRRDTDPDGAHDRPPDDVAPEWADTHLATVFSRWHRQLQGLLRAPSAALVAAAELRSGHAVLDVACGSGVPSLAVAGIVGPEGRVVATDPSPVFLAALEENAQAAGLTNLEAVRASAEGLPFSPATFDVATCHLGVMFFPDVRAGLTRIREVLRPGGRAALVAWGSDADNTLMQTMWGAAGPHLPPDPPPSGPPPNPDPPRPNRFAEPGSLSAALSAAGFSDVREDAPLVDLLWPEGPSSLVRYWLELSRVEERVPPERHAALRADIEAAYARFRDGDTVRLPARIVLATARA